VPESCLIVEHETEYLYSAPVAFAQHLAYLRPLEDDFQEVRDYALEVEPTPTQLQERRDSFGNARSFFACTEAHERLRVRARSQVRLRERFAALDTPASPAWETVRDSLHFVAGRPFVPAAEFSFASSLVPCDAVLRDYAAPLFGPQRPFLEAALELMHRIHADFRYDTTSTDVSTPVLQAFAARSGVCQDFSHVMIACLRSLGLAARYVSGYLHTQARFCTAPAGQSQAAGGPAPSPASSPTSSPASSTSAGTGVVGADASHAWVAVYCPHNGWVELDPTNDAIPGTGHVRLAYGRDYRDVAPLRGVVQGGGEHILRVGVRLRELDA